MMPPSLTFSDPYTLTPRLLDIESLPFLVDPDPYEGIILVIYYKKKMWANDDGITFLCAASMVMC